MAICSEKKLCSELTIIRMPSLMRVMGNYFPERALFQLVAAIASGR